MIFDFLRQAVPFDWKAIQRDVFKAFNTRYRHIIVIGITQIVKLSFIVFRPGGGKSRKAVTIFN